MSGYNRYRIFKNNGEYEVAVAKNRFDAVQEAKKRYHLKDKELRGVCVIKGNGTQRIFKI